MVRVQSVTGVGVLISPSAPSVRHWDRLWSSAVKGEVGVVLFTLTFDSSPIKGEGIRLCCLIHPCHPAALWILP